MLRCTYWVCLIFVVVCMGCSQESEQVPARAQPVSNDHIGYYCNMIVVNHAGPKGQIQLTNKDQALWFTSVRDTIAFTLLPEEPKNIAAIFVTAMDQSEWDHPENELSHWLAAESAWYVIRSEKRGGMGQLEAIPFEERNSALKFAEQHGGEVVAYDAIPRDYILGAE